MSRSHVLIMLIIAVLVLNPIYLSRAASAGDPPRWLQGLTWVDSAAMLAVAAAMLLTDNQQLQMASLVVVAITTVASRGLAFRHYTRQAPPR